MKTDFDNLFSDLLKDHFGVDLDRKRIDLQYLYTALQGKYIPGEMYLGSISENAIPTQPFESLRVGGIISLLSDKGGPRTFRPLFIHNETPSDLLINQNETRPRITGQEIDEIFYGYCLKEDIQTLPKLLDCRIGETKLRSNHSLMEVFVKRNK